MRKPLFLSTFLLILPLLASCGGGSQPPQQPFQGNSGRTRSSAGNAEIDGPGADELIRQSRRDYQRDKRGDRRYYGNY